MKYYQVKPIDVSIKAIVKIEDFINLNLDQINLDSFWGNSSPFKMYLVDYLKGKSSFRWKSIYKSGIHLNYGSSISTFKGHHLICSNEMLEIINNFKIPDYKLYPIEISNEYIPKTNHEIRPYVILHFLRYIYSEYEIKMSEFMIEEFFGPQLELLPIGTFQNQQSYKELYNKCIADGKRLRPSKLYTENKLDLLTTPSGIIVSETLKSALLENKLFDLDLAEFTEFEIIH
jgi:hypothetical protein